MLALIRPLAMPRCPLCGGTGRQEQRAMLPSGFRRAWRPCDCVRYPLRRYDIMHQDRRPSDWAEEVERRYKQGGWVNISTDTVALVTQGKRAQRALLHRIAE